jgi:hypothetical protein
MLHGRRLLALLFVALMALPFAGLDLFGQAKDDKKKDDKKTEQEKVEKKSEPKKEEPKKEEPKKEESKDPTKSPLEWKFEKGKTFYQTMTTSTNQTMKVMNNDVKQDQKQTFYFSWTPIDKDKDGKWTLEQKILGVKMDIDIGGSPIKYDSTGKDPGNASNPLSEFFKALVGSTFKVTLDPKSLKITKIEGRQEFVERLVKANKQMQPLLDKILSEDALKQMAEPTFAVVPSDAAVEKGKTWKRETPLDMGPIGKYKNEYTYKYEGPDDKDKNLDKISVETKLTYTPPEKAEGIGQLPFRIKSAKLESKKANGTVWFNRKMGRVEKTDMSVELGGTLEIEIGGQQTKVDLTQTQETKVETSDTDPTKSSTPSK